MTAKPNTVSAGLKPLYSFEQLVIGPNNHVAAAACHEVSEKPGEAYNPLFIYGPAGVGKTHLMQAVAHEMVSSNPHIKVKYISAERFTSEVVTAISEDHLMDFRKQYGHLDLLILDDVQYLNESKVAQEEFFHIFNNMHHDNHQVILASDRPPNQLTSLNKNIQTRLEWGLSTDVQVPDVPTRVEILRKKQDLQELQLSEEMLVYAAGMLRSNVRELEGFLKRIHAYVTLSKQRLTVDLVKSVVREILPAGQADQPPETGVTNPSAPQKYSRQESSPPPVGELPPAPPVPAKNGKGNKPSPAPSEGVSFDTLLDSIEIDAEPPPASTEKPSAASGSPAAKTKSAPKQLPVPASEPHPVQKSKLTKEEAPPPIPPSPPVSVPMEKEDVVAPDPAILIDETNSENLPSGHKEVGAVFFFPEGHKDALETVNKKFQEVIRKHKLKFRLKRVHDQPYQFKGKINYAAFVEVCKENKVPVAVVIGPPPDTHVPEQDFYDLLTVTLDVQGVSLQLVNWGEISKDYRYLNLALDIALVRSR